MKIEHITVSFMLVASRIGMNPKDAGSIMVGFISGISKDDHLDEIQSCVDGAENLEQQVVDAIEKIEKLDLITGFDDLVKALSSLPSEVKTCENI